jgi:hypothetical protein
MVMLLWNPLRRLWNTAFDAPAPVAAMTFRRPPVRPARTLPSALRQAAQPLTPFRVSAAASGHGPAQGARRVARKFWMTLDPQDRRRAAIGGSFAEVCAALERLAAAEEGARH